MPRQRQRGKQSRFEKIAQRQREEHLQKGRTKRAESARDKFKPTKSDKGKIVFVGTTGKKGVEKKGRAGYAIYVTKTGKKQLIRDKSGKIPTAKPISKLELPITRRLRKERKEFSAKYVVEKQSGEPVLKGKGEKERRSGTDSLSFGPNSSLAREMTKSVQDAFERQAARRNFRVRVEALIKTPEGETKRIETVIPITGPDFQSLKKGQAARLVQGKIYAHFARELAFEGYITQGSANHVMDAGEEVDEDLDIVSLESLNWQIEQLEFEQ